MQEQLDALYEALIAAMPGSTPRPGQRQMLHILGDVLESARFDPEADARIAVVEAGTGVGKTRAYLAAGLLLARKHGVKLVVSTSTVALQEQVLFKDLPELGRALEDPPSVALLKGRGRYVCPVRLDAAASGEQEPLELEEPGATAIPLDASAERAQRLRQRLRSAQWDGERDSLGQEDLGIWSAIAAERGSCTSRHCPQFNDCPYFDAKRAASRADVLVTNHDLVLASLRNDQSSLPNGERAIYVFDEGHHLPATALAHFACEASLTERRWLQRLEKALLNAASALRYPGQGFDACSAPLIQALDDLLRGLLEHLGPDVLPSEEEASNSPRRVRLDMPNAELLALWQSVAQSAQRWHDRAQELSLWMRQARQDDEDLAPLVAQLVADIGGPFRRLSELLELCQLMQQDGDPPPARWLLLDGAGGLLRVTAKASPLFAGGVLRHQLWQRMRAAVVTSATLKALGRFDFFLREAGLADLAGLRAESVSSPFNYASQGRFLVVATRSSPKDAQAHTAEVAQLLAKDLQAVEHGALVLCSSWVQLRALVAALPGSLRERAQVQGEGPRDQLLRQHRTAIRNGEPSILIGLQSFGEGLDLPGRECEWVFMPKLPFLTPDDPVAEARAEWLESRGRNPFVELVVPATGVRLNQWAGRGIRSEQDHATIVCYDPRLVQTAFGRQLLAGLPPFSKAWRNAGDSRLQPIA